MTVTASEESESEEGKSEDEEENEENEEDEEEESEECDTGGMTVEEMHHAIVGPDREPGIIVPHWGRRCEWRHSVGQSRASFEHSPNFNVILSQKNTGYFPSDLNNTPTF